MAKICVKTFIKRGQEIDKENLRANGIYAVRYTLPAEIAAEHGTVQEQWGIVKLDAERNIMLTWNVAVFNSFDTTTDKPWMDKLTFFRSSAMERQFFDYFEKWADEHIRYNKRIDDMEQRLLDIQTNTARILRHPLHRIADRLITTFS